MRLRWLIEAVVCAGVALGATTARAADDPPALVLNADAAGDASEALPSEAAPAADAADGTTAKAEEKKDDGEDGTVGTVEAVTGEEDADAKDVATTLGAQNVAIAGGGKRPFYLAGTAQFRTPVVTDSDPANDRSMNYGLTAGFHLFKGAQLMARISLQQRFVAESGMLPANLPDGTVDYSGFDQTIDDSSLRLGNLNFAFMFVNPVKLDIGDFARDITMIHRGGIYLPTSRQSQVESFYLGVEGLTVARMNVVDQLYVNVAGLAQWRGHEFAERAGPQGTPLPRFAFVGQLALEYLVDLGDLGSLTFGADISGSETVNYPARDSFESENSDAVYIRPGYGYDFYVAWVPLPFLSAGVAWEQGGNVVRNGIVNTFFFHRDETRLAFSVTARY